MIFKIRYEQVLLLLAIGWALLFSWLLQLQPGFSPTGDDGTYLSAARDWYLQGRFNDSRPLLIATLNGIPYWFGFGDSGAIAWSNALNLLCWGLSSLLVFKTTATFGTRKNAFIAAAIFIFCIGNLANAFNLLSEPVFVFLLLLSVWLLALYEKTKKGKFITWAISVLLMAILVKPLALGITLIVAVFYFKKHKEVFWNKSAVLLVLPVFLLAFQLIGMKRQFGQYTISYVGTATYYNYLGGQADCLQKGIPFVPGENKRAKYFNQLTNRQQRKLATDDFKRQLHDNKLNLAKSYLLGLYSNSSKASFIVSEATNKRQTSYFEAAYLVLKSLSKLQTILFTVVGILLALLVLLRRETAALSKTAALAILYIFLVSGMSSMQCDRFHLVFFPLVIILGMVGMSGPKR